MGITWMTTTELAQAIPPAYTEHIGAQLLALIPDEVNEHVSDPLNHVTSIPDEVDEVQP